MAISGWAEKRALIRSAIFENAVRREARKVLSGFYQKGRLCGHTIDRTVLTGAG